MSGEEVGSRGRIAIDTALPFDGSSIWLDIESEDIVKTVPILRDDGLRGTRMRESARGAIGTTIVSGTINLVMTRKALDVFLPAALGAAEVSDVFDVAETLPDLYILIDKRTDVVLVSEATVDVLTVNFQTGLVKLSVKIEAEDMTGGQTWPEALVQPDLTKPYVLSDLNDITLLSTARQVFGGSIAVNNHVSADQFANNLTRDELLVPTDREVTLAPMFGAGTENADLMDHVGTAGVAGEAVSLVFASGNESGSTVTFAFGRVAFPQQQPKLGGKGPLRLELSGEARGHLAPGAVGHVPDIKVTNAHS